MTRHGQNGGITAQELTDAGCGQSVIDRFLELEAQGKKSDCLSLLARHRCRLVCQMHAAQKPLDVLDYLIRELKQQP